MAHILQPALHYEISRLFDDESEVDYVEKVLQNADLPRSEEGPLPRIHLALIWLSKGFIKRFDLELSMARFDWRDTLMRAGLAGFDWRNVAQSRGIDCRDW